jgi:hypothetical protein
VAKGSGTKSKKVKRLGVGTVVKPCLVGVVLLSAVHAVLPYK